MDFEQDKRIENIGIKLGFISAFLIFTVILNLILLLLKKVPKNWTYWDTMLITFCIVLVGIIVKRFLK